MAEHFKVQSLVFMSLMSSFRFYFIRNEIMRKKCENFVASMNKVNRSEMLKKLNWNYGVQFNFFNKEAIKNLELKKNLNPGFSLVESMGFIQINNNNNKNACSS